MASSPKAKPAAAPQIDVSLMRGGPFYRLQTSARLTSGRDWNAGRLIIFSIAVGWVPILIMKLLFDRGNLMPFLRDYGVNSRMLVGVPILLLGQPLMERHFRMIVTHIYKARMLDDIDLMRMNSIIESLLKLRDSIVPELVILALVFLRTGSLSSNRFLESPWMGSRVGDQFHLGAAGWYALLVSATIAQFLLGLSLWKWLLWTLFAFKLSRMNLKVLPTHPDENGGLGFLGMTPLAFAPVAFALTLTIGATFRHDILYNGSRLQDFLLPAAVLLAAIAVVALGPLAFFVPRLSMARRYGLLEYAVVGQVHSTKFHEKWIYNLAEHETELISAPEISTLCDYGQAYEKMEKMKPFPLDRGALVGLGIAVVLAAFPTILAEIPLVVVLKQLLGALK